MCNGTHCIVGEIETSRDREFKFSYTEKRNGTTDLLREIKCHFKRSEFEPLRVTLLPFFNGNRCYAFTLSRWELERDGCTVLYKLTVQSFIKNVVPLSIMPEHDGWETFFKCNQRLRRMSVLTDWLTIYPHHPVVWWGIIILEIGKKDLFSYKQTNRQLNDKFLSHHQIDNVNLINEY